MSVQALQKLFPEVEVEILKVYLEHTNNSVDLAVSLLVENGVPMTTSNDNRVSMTTTTNVAVSGINPVTEIKSREFNDIESIQSLSNRFDIDLPQDPEDLYESDESEDEDMVSIRRAWGRKKSKVKPKMTPAEKKAKRKRDMRALNLQTVNSLESLEWTNLFQNGSVFLNEKGHAEIIVYRCGEYILSIDKQNSMTLLRREIKKLNVKFRPLKTYDDIKPFCYGPFYFWTSNTYSSHIDAASYWLQSNWFMQMGHFGTVIVMCNFADSDKFRRLDLLKNPEKKREILSRHYFWLISDHSFNVDYNAQRIPNGISVKFYKALTKKIWQYNLFTIPNREYNVEMEQDESKTEQKQQNAQQNESKMEQQNIDQVEQNDSKMEQIESIGENKSSYNESNTAESPLAEEYLAVSDLNIMKMRFVYAVFNRLSGGNQFGHTSNRILDAMYNSVNYFTRKMLKPIPKSNGLLSGLESNITSLQSEIVPVDISRYQPFAAVNSYSNVHNLNVGRFLQDEEPEDEHIRLPYELSVEETMTLESIAQNSCHDFSCLFPMSKVLSQDAQILGTDCYLRDIDLSSEQIATIRFLILNDQTPFSGIISTTISLYNACGERFVYDYARNVLHKPEDIELDKRAAFNIGQMGSGKTITTGAMILFDLGLHNMWDLHPDQRYLEIHPTLRKYFEQIESESKPEIAVKRSGKKTAADSKNSKDSKESKDSKDSKDSKELTKKVEETVTVYGYTFSRSMLSKQQFNKYKMQESLKKLEANLLTLPDKELKVDLPTTLILCKPSLISNWETEILGHFDTRIKYLNAYGRAQKKITLKELLSNHIVITSYESFRNGNQFAIPLNRLKFRRVVCDEAHELRVANTGINRKLNETDSDRWYFLTGTPVISVLKDLSPLIRLCDANVVKERVVRRVNGNQSNVQAIIEEGTVDEHLYGSKDPAYFSILANLSVRASKENVLKLQNYTRSTTKIVVEFSPAEKKVYEEQFQQAQLLVKSIGIDNGIARRHVFNNLRRICSYAQISAADRDLVRKEIVRLQQAREAGQNSLSNRTHINRFSTVIDLEANGTAEQEAFQCRSEACVICLEEFDDTSAQLRRCRHVYHKLCLQGILNALQARCPICRTEIKAVDIQKAKFPPEQVLEVQPIAEIIEEVVEEVLEEEKANEEKISEIKVAEVDPLLLCSVSVLSKVNTLVEIIKAEYNEFPPPPKRDKCLIFSSFPLSLQIIKARLEAENIKVVSLSCAASQRGKLINKFRTEEDCTVLLLSPHISAGLNLTCANTSYFFEPLDNVHLFNQAAGRIDRISQKKNINTVHLIFAGSIEARLLNLNERRLSVLQDQQNNQQIEPVQAFRRNPNNGAGFSDSNQLTSLDINNLLS